MTYFPDYRKETDKLNEVDQAFIDGFRAALESADTFFDNLPDDELYSFEKEVIDKVKARLEEWMESDEIQIVCSRFANADYLPEDLELVDANKVKSI